MKASSIILSAIAGSVVLYLLGYLFYIIILGNLDLSIKSVAKIERDPVVLLAIVLMEIGYALLMTLIFTQWANIRTFLMGLKAGAIIGLLIGLCVGLQYFATTYLLNLTGVFLYALTFAVRFALAGGIIGMVLGRRIQD